MSFRRFRRYGISVFIILAAACVLIPTRQPPPPSDFELDPVKLTCDDFNNYALNTGVTVVENGQRVSRKSAAGSIGGSTELEVSYPPPGLTTRASQRIFCNCNDKYYDSATECLGECRASLGCFTGICEPADTSQQVCANTTATLRGILNLKMYRLDWQPPSGSLTDACQSHVQAWNQQVENHERRHMSISQEVVTSTNERWKRGQHFEACVETEGEAIRLLESQIDVWSDAELLALKNEMKRQNDLFHEEDSHVSQLDCDICG